MLGCQNRKKPFKLSPGITLSGDDGKLASSASTQHVSKVAKVGFHDCNQSCRCTARLTDDQFRLNLNKNLTSTQANLKKIPVFWVT